jgi:carbon storage regulator CsrA
MLAIEGTQVCSRKELSVLVLSRQRNQAIWIDNVKILVVDTRRDRVQLGITAPSHVQIHREETHEASKRGREPPPAEALAMGT